MALQSAIEENVEFRKALPLSWHNEIGMSNSEKVSVSVVCCKIYMHDDSPIQLTYNLLMHVFIIMSLKLWGRLECLIVLITCA